MQEFSLEAFGKSLQSKIADAIPFPDNVVLDEAKHKKERNPAHLQEQVKTEFTANYEIVSNDTQAFNLGSERLESIYPHYHILEDSEVIHKKGEGTKTSKGSQASLPKSERDYGNIVMRTNKSKSGYALSQEYRKNVRGKRSALNKNTYRIVKPDGQVITREIVFGTKSSTTYYNKHYHYIEKNLDSKIVAELCTEFGLKQQRKKISSLLDSNEDFMLTVFNL